MAKIDYDPHDDSMYLDISSKKAYFTVEVGERLSVDVSDSRVPVGIEILEASKFISNLFGKSVSKEKVKNMLCNVTQKDAIYLDFEITGPKREVARFAIPKMYPSPVLSL